MILVLKTGFMSRYMKPRCPVASSTASATLPVLAFVNSVVIFCRVAPACRSATALPSGRRRAPAAPVAPVIEDGLHVGHDIYQSIGVRPLINARGTFTIISGSLMLPEVRAAIDAAAQHHVHLDELMAAIGARLAELTKAEWGMVSSGCAAGLTHATAACVGGGNPDLHVRMPNLSGFAKDEVIIPKHSRHVT